jgi:hypothetical protein
MTTITARNRTNRTVQLYVPGGRYLRIAPHATCTLEPGDCQSPIMQKLVREGVMVVARSSGPQPGHVDSNPVAMDSAEPIAAVETQSAADSAVVDSSHLAADADRPMGALVENASPTVEGPGAQLATAPESG